MCICNGILFGLKKWNSTICNNIDELRGYDTEWNKPDTGKQMLCDLTYMWNLKMLDAEIESKRLQGEMGRCWSKGTKF